VSAIAFDRKKECAMRNLAVAGTFLLVVIAISACGGSKAASTIRSATAAPSTTTMPPVMTASSVTQLVTTFYDQYLACYGPNSAGSGCASNVVKEYGTANLGSYYTPPAGYAYQADPIVCAQNKPTGVRVSGVTTTANRASGTVSEEGFGAPNTTSFVVVDQSGTQKIDTISCDPPVTPAKLPTTTLAPSTTTPPPITPSGASIQSAICAAAFPNVGDGEHCAVGYLKVSTVNQNWISAAVGLYNAQNQPESDTGDLIYNLSTHQLIGPTSDGFCGEGTSTPTPVPGYSSVPSSVLADFGLSPCSPAATTGSPNVSTPSTATIPFTLASLAGTWQAHDERVVFNTTGTGHVEYPDFTLCPSCSFATAPMGTVVFGLTSVTNNLAAGSVTASSDPKTATVGEAVQVTLAAGSPGQLLHLDIGGGFTLPYCNGAAEATSQCGA
jgi:hypothetical protein